MTSNNTRKYVTDNCAKYNTREAVQAALTAHSKYSDEDVKPEKVDDDHIKVTLKADARARLEQLLELTCLALLQHDLDSRRVNDEGEEIHVLAGPGLAALTSLMMPKHEGAYWGHAVTDWDCENVQERVRELMQPVPTEYRHQDPETALTMMGEEDNCTGVVGYYASLTKYIAAIGMDIDYAW